MKPKKRRNVSKERQKRLLDCSERRKKKLSESD